MSTTRVRFLKSAAGPTFSAAAGDWRMVPTEFVPSLVAAGAIAEPAAVAVVVVAASEAASEVAPAPSPVAETETAIAPPAPENAKASPNPRRGRRGGA